MTPRLMIAPPPPSIMTGIACLPVSIMLLRLVSMTRSQSPSSTPTTFPGARMPTLFTRMSRRPYRLTAASTMRRQSSERVTSTCSTNASPPSARIVASVSSAWAVTASASNTWQPLAREQNCDGLARADAWPARTSARDDRNLDIESGRSFLHRSLRFYALHTLCRANTSWQPRLAPPGPMLD